MNQVFSIFKLTEENLQGLLTAPNQPHDHDYEELILATEGSMEHFIDFKSTSLVAPFACFVTKGKVHRVIPGKIDGKCRMWVMRFKSEFIPETTFQLYAYYHDHANIPLDRGACFGRMSTLCEMMAGEMQQDVPDFSIIRHLLSALFTMIESERRKQHPSENGLQKTQNTTFKNFLRILEENYHRPEGVEFYAEKLFMSARNLNMICQNILQRSVSEIIETRKLIEAKNLLANTEKSISEIGFELGYQEKSYFSTVFKKKSGQTPREFREEMKKLLS